MRRARGERLELGLHLGAARYHAPGRFRDVSNPAEGYERFMVPPLFRPWAGRLVDGAGPEAGERILDIACGTGIVAREVAARLRASATIAAVDASPAMLAVAREAATREGAAIEWHEGRAEALPFTAASFDLALCQFALMFFADRAAAVAEMRRVLAEGGRVAVSTWLGLDRHPFYDTLHRIIEQRVGISALQQIFSLGNADELRELFTRAGFEQVTATPVTMTARFPNPEGFLAGEIDVDTAAIPSMQHADAAERQRIVESIAGDMRKPLAGVTHGEHVVLEFHAHVLTARS